MLFNSFQFLIFLPIVFILYWFIFKKLHIQNLLVVVTSYIFYGWWDWRFCFLMLLLTAIAYITARQLKGKYRNLFIAIGVSVPLIVLGIFKYLQITEDRIVGKAFLPDCRRGFDSNDRCGDHKCNLCQKYY